MSESSSSTTTLGQVTTRCPLTENQASLLLASSGKSTSSTTVEIHPIVFLHIADHHHRNIAQHGSKSQVFGALLGRQDGQKAEICFAFEIAMMKVDERYVLDKTYWIIKEEQFKQVLPGMDYIGWYTVSDDYLTTEDLELQNQFWEVSQNPFLLKVHANKPDAFPADLFESVIEFVAGAPTVRFIPLSFTVIFEQAEQIGVHHIATKADAESAGSVGAETDFQISMRAMSSAVRMLQERLAVISQYNKAVADGILSVDEQIMTELKRIVELLGSLDSDEQKDKYNTMKLQATMTASVGSYTQSVESLLDFIRKNFAVTEKRTVGKGMMRSRMESGFGLPGMSAFPGRGAKSKPTRFRPGNIFRKSEKNEPRSNGGIGEPSH